MLVTSAEAETAKFDAKIWAEVVTTGASQARLTLNVSITVVMNVHALPDNIAELEYLVGHDFRSNV